MNLGELLKRSLVLQHRAHWQTHEFFPSCVHSVEIFLPNGNDPIKGHVHRRFKVGVIAAFFLILDQLNEFLEFAMFPQKHGD